MGGTRVAVGPARLSQAAGAGDVDIVSDSLQRGAVIDMRGSGDSTPLIQAAQHGHFAVVQLLIKRGANIQLSTSGGRTALWCAAFSRHVEIMELLIERRANIDAAPCNDQVTALWRAASQGWTE